MFRQSGGRWEKYQEPRFLRNERRIIEEQLQVATQNVENRQTEKQQGFQPQESRNDQGTVDPFWETDRPRRQQSQPNNEPGPSSRQIQHIPMVEGETDSETDQDPLVLDVPAVN